ncbi:MULTISPECIES: protein kinase domain-containing protein [Nitrincola]|uniref:Serine/threonine-protein kinase C n=1 Tax=Nitrincola nitratireducens TaxID=1229521 RepID=W9UYY4_9GAMM|nr:MULTISPECIES: protein kinase [Nitrincola]EXJ09122.1 Serine/threonine-protein kinase C [Nitrincola nitratireducens]
MNKPTFNHLTLPQGYQLGDYIILDLLGQGGFGIAYLAQDIHLQNQVVIKEYFPSDLASRDGQTVSALGTNGQIDYEKGMARFLEEGRALARFNHPAVVRILKYFQQNNTAYLVMEFIDGEPLDSYLKRKHTLTPEVVEHLAKELLDGLEVVHQHGLIHRDIKPANIMLRPGGKPVLIDFGAAKEELAEKSHSVVVTPGYGALEQYSSKAKLAPATDLYAFGATLYKCLTAQTPEESSARVLDDTHIPVNQLPIAQQCSPGLVALIDQCMHLKGIDRPQNAQLAKVLLTETGSENRTPPQPLKNDSAVLDAMIEMAGSDGIITQQEINLIITKAQTLGVDVVVIRNIIDRLAGAKGWRIEPENSNPKQTKTDAEKNESSKNAQSKPKAKAARPVENISAPLISNRYHDHNDGTVTDTHTGLMWMRYSIGQEWYGQICTGEAIEHNWTAATLIPKGGFFRRFSFADYSDWRLPSIQELHTLVYCSSGQQRGFHLDSNGRLLEVHDIIQNGRCEGDYQTPTINPLAFPATPASWFWSSSPISDSNYRAWGVRSSAWGVSFCSGHVSNLNKSDKCFVRLVRTAHRN